MGLSFHDQDSLVDRVGSLRFASAGSNPILETGSVGDQENPGGDLADIEIQFSADSDIGNLWDMYSSLLINLNGSKKGI